MSGIDKNSRMLGLYHQLIAGKHIDKQSYCVENEITERSFDRDIEDVRLFLCEEHSYCELIYDRNSRSYYLTHTIGKSLPGELTLYLADVIFSQKNLSEDEMNGMLLSLLEVTDIYRCTDVSQYMNERIEGKICLSKKAILKMHWDLERAIQKKKQIEMYYEVAEERCDLRIVEPVQLKVENGFSYLVAFILNEKYDKPAFFRLDRIHSFKIMDIKIQEDVFLKYSEQNKKYDLFNMIAGDEQEIVLSVSARMRRVICDVFPKCVFVEECNSKYVYKIKTYKQGFMQWLMGQEEVEVLDPKDMRKEICEKYEENLRRYRRKE